MENEIEFTPILFQANLSFNGNSNNTINYNSKDENASTGKSYYRLKQEVINGKFSYSIVRVIEAELASTINLKV